MQYQRSGFRDSELVAIPLALLAAIGTLLPWAESAFFSRAGIGYGAGAVVLVAGIGMAIVAGLYCARVVSLYLYVTCLFVLATSSLLACGQFWMAEVGKADPYTGASFFITPRVTPRLGWYTSATL